MRDGGFIFVSPIGHVKPLTENHWCFSKGGSMWVPVIQETFGTARHCYTPGSWGLGFRGARAAIRVLEQHFKMRRTKNVTRS